MSIDLNALGNFVDSRIKKHGGGGEDGVSHMCHCPECYKDLFTRMNQNSKYACRDCGVPLGDAEFAQKLEECPSCGSKDAEEVRHE